MGVVRVSLAAVMIVLTSRCAGPDAHDARNTAPMPADLSTLIQRALADAARRSGRDASELAVESATRVTWRDGSLGCPEPGMAYTQALVPGYRIRVRAGSTLLDYHASTRGLLVACPPERAIEPLPDDRT